jgi:hypothetical protein
MSGGLAFQGLRFEVGSSKFSVPYKHTEYNSHPTRPWGWSGGTLDIP